MHFWIDKRSQTCGFGRSRPNASLYGGRIGFGHHPPRRNRRKSWVTPVRSSQSQRTAHLRRHNNHHLQNGMPFSERHEHQHGPHESQSQYSNAQTGLNENQQSMMRLTSMSYNQSPSYANQQHASYQYQSSPQRTQHYPRHSILSNTAPEYSNILQQINHSPELDLEPRQVRLTVDQHFRGTQLLPSHLKCGILASLLFATVFVAVLYGNDLEVLCFFCAFTVLFLITACVKSLCRRPRSVLLIPTTGSNIHTIGAAELIQQSTNDEIAVPEENVQIDEAVGPPPPYHIAIMLPESSKDNADAPPPSYDNIC